MNAVLLVDDLVFIAENEKNAKITTLDSVCEKWKLKTMLMKLEPVVRDSLIELREQSLI